MGDREDGLRGTALLMASRNRVFPAAVASP